MPTPDPIKPAFSTNAYTRFPLVDAIRDIATVGYSGVEILADVPHAYPDSIDAELVKSVRDVLDETGTLESWWAMEAAPDPQEPRPSTQPSVGNTSSRKVRTRPSPSPGHSITR